VLRGRGRRWAALPRHALASSATSLPSSGATKPHRATVRCGVLLTISSSTLLRRWSSDSRNSQASESLPRKPESLPSSPVPQQVLEALAASTTPLGRRSTRSRRLVDRHRARDYPELFHAAIAEKVVRRRKECAGAFLVRLKRACSRSTAVLGWIGRRRLAARDRADPWLSRRFARISGSICRARIASRRTILPSVGAPM